jgi:hypothetical protein
MLRMWTLTANLIFIGCLSTCGAAYAQQSIVQSVNQGCANELQTYCKDVTLGEGRVASCLYAYEDKLSLGCAEAVYRGIVDLEKANVSLRIYAKQCSSDLLQYCSAEVPGGGRLYNCLKKNKATLTADCARALKKGEPDMRRLGLIQ